MVFRRVVRAASGLALGNLGVVFRRVVRAACGLALGNLGVVFRRVVRAASGLALGNLGVVFRRVVRATEDGRRKKNVRQPSGTVTCLLLRGGDTVFEHL
ncbi:MAG: hypothetical protein ACLP51_19690 [Syntrophobacteraceae bacterium]